MFFREELIQIDTLPDITIAAPVRNRAWILPHYLSHLSKLDYPKKQISLLWVVNNSQDTSLKILNEFREANLKDYKSIKIEVINTLGLTEDVRDHLRHVTTYAHLSKIRNFILDYSSSYGLFSVDTDILLEDCKILKKLLARNEPIVASLIWNGYEYLPERPWMFSNALNITADGKFLPIRRSHVLKIKSTGENSVIPVDVTGACYLLRKEVYKQIRYSYHPLGEDVQFCLDCKTKGFQPKVDVSLYSQHIMAPKWLELWNQGQILF